MSTHAVTGAFGYSGKYIAQHLLEEGYHVITLTNAPESQDPFDGKVAAYPLSFDQPAKLVESLQGTEVLYNTYWVRFNHQRFTHAEAVKNTLILFQAAKIAGVQRIVHISITNPNHNSPLEYFNGKGILERALIESGISHAILRPTVLFGKEDILINNIAWMLRRLPVFGVFGKGNYRLQPIYVDDLAQLAVKQGKQCENVIIDAIGPEIFTYRELVQTIGVLIGKPRRVFPMPSQVGYMVGSVIGWLMRDVTITKEEIKGLMDDLLFVDSPPMGNTRLTDWVRENASSLGMVYANELARRR